MSRKDATSASPFGQVQAVPQNSHPARPHKRRSDERGTFSEGKPAHSGQDALPSQPEPPAGKAAGGASRPQRSEDGCEAAGRSSVDLIQEDKPYPGQLGEEKVLRRLDRQAKAKEHSRLVAEFARHYRPDDKQRAEKQLRCSTWLLFRAPKVQPDDWRLYAANFCQQTHTCEGCAIARASRLLASSLTAVVNLLNQRPNLEAHFVTLTVRNGQYLDDTYGRLHGGLLGMMHRRRDKAMLRSLVGGLGQIETKIGKSGGWHPHYHGLWFFDRKPDYSRLRETWSSAVGEDSNGEFRLLKAEELRVQGLERNSPQYKEQLIKDLCEVIKYTCKFAIGECMHLWEAAEFYRSKRARLFRRFGDVVGVEEPADLADECPDWRLVAFIERRYRWDQENKRYAVSQAPQADPKFQAWNEGRI